ncbi:MAG: hypothetical protein UW68_C0005G0012 [Candidatus Collierbacteria bacterium GW2011_GWB1_44_6]|uniref:Uncharacterized protein n=1 Tax=Candidatus Collierbacteria bacterium GW2011_GWB1_44_6 TaxID=1618384 RepID=A0A0G1MNP9_9BACT|nr:MAG: hypothetical protein UW68_C0005G0012 [Candidatus Collierbacteria bacterium GW2011_GWB1_44_6]
MVLFIWQFWKETPVMLESERLVFFSLQKSKMAFSKFIPVRFTPERSQFAKYTEDRSEFGKEQPGSFCFSNEQPSSRQL